MSSILTVVGITTLLMTIFTLVFQYFPGLRAKWGALSADIKRFVVLGLYLAFGGLVAFGGCVDAIANLVSQLQCTTAMGFSEYVIATVIAVGAGQGIFELLPETADVVAAKLTR